MKNLKACFSFIFLLLLSVVFNSCTTLPNASITPVNYDSYQIAVYNYSDFHYFLDTSYKSNFLDFEEDGILSNPENIARIVSSENFEIWIQTTNTTADRRFASLHIDLPPVPVSGNYDTSFYAPYVIQGKRYFGLFRKLNSSEYYINYQAGFVGLKLDITDNDYIGVTYKETGTEKIFGTNSYSGRDTLILKMMKAGNINPAADTLAWNLKMKNVYRLPVSNISQSGFELKIFYIDPATLFQTTELPNGAALLKATRLDEFIGSSSVRGHDNLFDFLPGRTIYAETGDIVFPTLRPFYHETYSATKDTSFSVSEIYTKRKSEAAVSPRSNIYLIKVKKQP